MPITHAADHLQTAHCFSSVQFSRSVVSDSSRPHESQHATPPCPSPTPGVHSNLCPSSWWCHPAISSSVVPFFSNKWWLNELMNSLRKLFKIVLIKQLFYSTWGVKESWPGTSGESVWERNSSFKESVNCFSRRRLMLFYWVHLLLVRIFSWVPVMPLSVLLDGRFAPLLV